LSTLRRALVGLAATTLAGGLVPAAQADPPVAVPDGSSVTLIGDGYGHGVGMSQYGAEGAAMDGLNYKQILRFYYPGTRLGEAGGSIKVDLTDDVDNDVVVHQRRGLHVRAVDAGRSWRIQVPRAKWWRSRLLADGRHQVSYRTNRWHTWRTISGDVEFTAGGEPIKLRTPQGVVAYRGALRSTIWATEGGPRRVTVNVLPLESYLRGVVPSEVIASKWKTQALRAQAVAARGYAVHERQTTNREAFDVFDTQASQVYGGFDAEWPTTDAAVKFTGQQVLTYDGQVAYTQFSASNGGWTAAAEPALDGTMFPYLRAKRDKYDARMRAYYGWTRDLTDADIEAQWEIGNLESVTIASRDGRDRNASRGGRVMSMTLTGDGGSVQVDGDTFQRRFGLRSTLFTLDAE